MRKPIIAFLLTAMLIASSASVFAGISETDKEKRSAASQPAKTPNASGITRVDSSPAFDPYSAAAMKAEYSQSKKASKKFSTTTKVLIGVGVAAAVLAIVFVAARNDLKDDILR